MLGVLHVVPTQPQERFVYSLEVKRDYVGRIRYDCPPRLPAAQVIGVDLFRYKLLAFATSSFFAGLAGALTAHYRGIISWERFTIETSIVYLSMIIIGGLGSVSGSIYGAAFIVLLPIVINQIPGWFGIPISTALASHLELMIFGSLIVFFLIVEPHGLARLWAIGKEKLRLWPFPH